MVDPLNTKSWVLVPVEPTPEMVAAGERADDEHLASPPGFYVAKAVWAAMLSATPALPAVDGGGEDATLEKLRAVEATYPEYPVLLEAIREAASLILSQKGEIERLRKALKPFADYLDGMPFDLDNNGNPLPDDTGPGWTYLTAGDFRRARSALQEKQNG